MHTQRYNTLINKLTDLGFREALAAMKFAEQYHTGFRKDGVTPEFDHQVSIALHALTLSGVDYMERLLTVIFLHDVSEDYDVSKETLAFLFGEAAAEDVDSLNKFNPDGTKRDPHILFDRMADSETASVAKLLDRSNNLKTMVGVFNAKKQDSYINETYEFFFPMLEKAKENFPDQATVYENLRQMLETQIYMVQKSR